MLTKNYGAKGEKKVNKTFSVIIPCKNQEYKLPDTFKDIAEHIQKVPYDVEVIFVNDRSSDTSPQVANKYGKKLYNFKHLSTPKDIKGIGKGRAVKIGMLEAESDLQLFMDADNSTSFIEINKLLDYNESFDIVIGTRYSAFVTTPETKWLKGVIRGIKDIIDVLIYGHAKRYTATGKQGRMRQFVSRGGNLAFTVLLGQSFTDQRCGFKLFSKKASDIIFPHPT